MTDILKCSSCNIVIDELLSYIQNKISVIDEESLYRICVSNFSSDEIKKSKMLLFESVPTKKPPINRKNKGKEQRDLEDIVCLLRSVQTDQIPIFVARHLEKLPPVTFDHLDCTKLLKDLVKLQSEVSTIKDTYATVSQLEAVKTELHQMKHDSLPPTTMFNNINTNRRGAWTDIDSGPIGLSQCHDDDNFTSNDVINSHKIKSSTAIATLSLCDSEVRAQRDESLGGRGQPAEVALRRNIGDSSEAVGATRTMHTQGCREMASEGADSGAGGARSPVSQEASALAGSVTSLAPSSSSTAQTAAAAARQLTATDKAKLSNERVHNKLAQPLFDATTNVNTDNQGGWQQVVNRKKQTKYRFSGKSGVARDLQCTFRAAERKIPMFISNVHISTTEKDIINYIYNKTEETVSLKKINMKFDRGHKAYKFLVSEANLSRYMDETLWPAGIIFRRFVHFEERKISGTSDTHDADGLKKTNNE